jgi:hypothetical protein
MKEMTPRSQNQRGHKGGSAFAVVSFAFVRREPGDACSPLSRATRQSPMTSAAPPVSAATKQQH